MFVSVSLMEVALITYLSDGNTSGTEPSADVETMTTATMTTVVGGRVNEKDNTDRKGRRKGHIIHRLSRIVFPAVFCAFNVVYWVYYI